MVEVLEFDEPYFSSVCHSVALDAAELRELLCRSGQSTSRVLDDLDVVLDQATVLRLAVIGDFKRGKSSVINAVVGESLLPTDVLPCTSGIIELAHGPTTEYELVRDGIPSLQTREDFLAGAGSASSAPSPDGVEETWRVRTPLMPRGLVLVDTPGLNEDEWRIALTQVEASRCHASLLVLAADQPLSRSEAEILEVLPTDSTAFLLNRSDLVSRDDLDRVADHVAQRLPATRSAEPQMWRFAALGRESAGGRGLTTADELRRELEAFVAQRSLTSRAQRLQVTVKSTTTELQSRAADRVGILEGDKPALESAHEQALAELDRARGTSGRIVKLLQESAERISIEAGSALRKDWDGIIARWEETSERWRSDHPLHDVGKWKAIAEDMADDALAELQREFEEWTAGLVDEVIVPVWDEALDAAATDVTEFLRSLDRVAPTGAPQVARSLRDLHPEGAIQGAVTHSVIGGALGLGIGAALRVVILRQLATVLATRLALFANPALVAAGIAMLVLEARGFKDRLRREVRRAMRRQLKQPETVETVVDEFSAGVRESLDADIRDVRSNLDAWIDDARSFVSAKWDDLEDTEAELHRRQAHLDDVTSLCDRMVSRLEPLPAQSG